MRRISALALIAAMMMALGACGLLSASDLGSVAAESNYRSGEVSGQQLISGRLPACNPAALITGDRLFDTLYAIALNDTVNVPQIKVLIPQTAQTVYRKTITSSAGEIDRVNGLAADPLTGTLWAIVRYQGMGQNRSLVTVDPLTGIATLIGHLGDAFAEIAFDACGRLFGVTGDGASVSETLYSIDKSDASPTVLFELGNGGDGEVIAINPFTNILYHASGFFSVFETVNINSGLTTAISLTGDFYGELNSLTFGLGGTAFYATDISGSLFNISTGGLSSFVGQVDGFLYDERTHGLAFAPGTVPTGDPESSPGEGEPEPPPAE